MAVDVDSSGGQGFANLFTASRDRLIKVWNVDYARMLSEGTDSETLRGNSVTLLADLDDHTDWVNQIKIIPEVRTLISCSNDTTIRIWRYKSRDSYEARN